MRSISDLGGFWAGEANEEQDPDLLVMVMPETMPFTASSIETAIDDFMRAGIDASIFYDGEYNSLVVVVEGQSAQLRIERILKTKTSLRAAQEPADVDLDVLALDCGSDEYPQIVIEPKQVITAAMINRLIDRFTGPLATRRDAWTSYVVGDSIHLEHDYAKVVADSKDEAERASVISYEDIALRVPTRYLYSGAVSARCIFDDEGAPPVAICHCIRIVSPIGPREFDLKRLRRLPGVTEAEVDEGCVFVTTEGKELRMYSNPRGFLRAVYEVGASLAKELNIFPTPHQLYELELGTGCTMVLKFGIV